MAALITMLCATKAHIRNAGTKRIWIVEGLNEIHRNVAGAVAAVLRRHIPNAGTKRTSIVDGLNENHRNVAGAMAAVLRRTYAMRAPNAYGLLKV